MELLVYLFIYILIYCVNIYFSVLGIVRGVKDKVVNKWFMVFVFRKFILRVILKNS